MLRNLRLILDHPFNRGQPVQTMGRYLGWQFKSRTASGHVSVPWVDKMRLMAKRGMVGATGNIYCGLHEHQEMGFILHFLRPGDLFVDVGANIGSYSILAAAAGADVVAYEPGERFVDLKENMRANGILADCRQSAVGAAAGVVNFTVGLDCTNKIAENGELSHVAKVVALDEDLPRPPTVVKIDVEGFEHYVFEGGSNSLANAEAIVIELGDARTRFFPILQTWGFTQIDYDPFHRFVLPPTIRVNTIWVKRDATARLAEAPTHHIFGRAI
jgi:FkbM family methyltransferase